MNRRDFVRIAALGSLGASALPAYAVSQPTNNTLDEKIREALEKPVLKHWLFPEPLLVESLELLQYKNNFLCRVRSTDGAEGVSVSNNMQMEVLYPIFIKRLQPFFIGKDMRQLERLIDEAYVHNSNYKLQNLALWVPMATIEFAILDLLGKLIQKPMGTLFGEIQTRKIAVYQANNYRGRAAEESIELIKQNVEKTQAKAVKFKVGGRMSSNADDPPGRTEKLIPLVRKTFGESMTIYADANGSYTVDEAIRIGRILEDYQVDFFEEPVPFDWYGETKQVADALSIPIAGGEQEPSMRNFQWMIENKVLSIVQPDIFYFGGMVRSTKVARMAHALNLECTPHISNSGLGYLYMMHFVSTLPNAGKFHEFKALNKEIPFTCDTSSLVSENGVVTVPEGPGLGIIIDPDFVNKHIPVKG